MFRKLLLTVVAVSLAAGFAFAQPVYLPSGGPWNGIWGFDCTDWVYYDMTGFDSGELLWDPIGQVLRDCNGVPVVWPTMTITCYVELEVIVHYDWLNCEIHLASFYSDFYIVFSGYVRANGSTLLTFSPLPTMTLDELVPIAGLPGLPTPIDGITVCAWEYSIIGATGPYYPMSVCGPAYTHLFGLCDHDFWVRLTINPVYHQEAGVYQLMAVVSADPAI